MSEPRYQITVSAEQLYLLCRATETCSRLVMGQMDMALDYLRDRAGKTVNDYDLTRAVEAMTKQAQGLDPNQSGGVGWHVTGDALWDLYTAMRHQLAWDRAEARGDIFPGGPREPSKMPGVAYDKPTSLTGPTVKIVRLEPGE